MIVVSETKKISTETSGGGLSNLFAYLYKQQFSIFLSRLQRESSHVFVAVIWIVVQWKCLLRSLVVYHYDLEMWFSFSPVFSQSIRKINEIYLPRNFTRNLFILYFYLLSFSAVFSIFCFKWISIGREWPTLFFAALCDFSIFSSVFYWFVYFPFSSFPRVQIASLFLRWLSLFFIKLGVSYFSINFPAYMHKIVYYPVENMKNGRIGNWNFVGSVGRKGQRVIPHILLVEIAAIAFNHISDASRKLSHEWKTFYLYFILFCGSSRVIWRHLRTSGEAS